MHTPGSPPDPSTSMLDADQHILAVSALFEESFSFDWLLEIVKERPSKILFALEKGKDKNWLVSKGLDGFCFKNKKEQRHLREYLLPTEREQIHRQIADVLIRIHPDDSHKLDAISYHLLRCENNAVTCSWLVKAGDHFRKINRYEEAFHCYQKALDDLEKLEGDDCDLLFIEASIKYSKISTARHDTQKVISMLKKAMERAKKCENLSNQALLKMHMAKNQWLLSQYEAALTDFKEGWAIAKGIEDKKLYRSINNFRTFFLYWQGRFRDAVQNYEQFIPQMEKSPPPGLPVLAALTVGHCYAHIGQVTQGLGMLDSVRQQCMERNDPYLEAHAGVTMAIAMVDIRHMEDACQYLEHYIRKAKEVRNDWIAGAGESTLAFAYYLQGATKRYMSHFNNFLQFSNRVHVNVWPSTYLMEILWAQKEGKLPRTSGLSLEKEVYNNIKGENIFMKGVAYRYQALLQREDMVPHENIIDTLNLSLKWLEQSGEQVEMAKTQLEMLRQYLRVGQEEMAIEMKEKASGILSSLNESLIPDDLRSFVINQRRDHPVDEGLLKVMLSLAGEVVSIRNEKELEQKIISTANQITGAERGAIFLVKENRKPPKIELRSSKNLTLEQVDHPSFKPSMRMIEEVAKTGKGQKMGLSPTDDPRLSLKDAIRSRICVPMICRDKVLGVLYHDNRLLISVFKESDLELLSYFATLATLALDNANAYGQIQRLNDRLGQEKKYYEEQHLQSVHFEEIVGQSAAIVGVLSQVDQVANIDTNVLIFGETGVGKELVARAIHRGSSRRDKPFIRVHCSALPESLIPSELFGHEKGAFTGAVQRHVGRFELADGGTLFLDEIGDLPFDIQTRLLRVLQTKEFERVGGTETLRSDFRLLAATNRDLKKEVEANKFRSDLFYRINVFPIYVPPLRQRKEDIPLLAHFFLKIYSSKIGKMIKEIPESEMDKLLRYDWPGNIRELENIFERGVILGSEPYFRVPKLGAENLDLEYSEGDLTLAGNERRHILWALQKTKWKVRGSGGAAELLHVHPSTLDSRMKKLGIQRPARVRMEAEYGNPSSFYPHTYATN
jgi:formate hydrogenlyase transcriptional activator